LCVSFSERRTILLRILEIDAHIRNIEQGKNYRRLKNDLRILEGTEMRGGIFTVHSPSNMEELVEMRRNSKVVGEYITQYRDKLRIDRNNLERLAQEKKTLEKDLFRKEQATIY